jgi:SAM-dependent methyltransferase
MRPFWHPLSAVLLSDPRVFATPRLVKLFMRGEGIEILVAGDRMSPSLSNGASVRVRSCGSASVPPGAVVLVSFDGALDLLRVVGMEGSELLLQGDSDPAERHRVPASGVLGVADVPAHGTSQMARWLRRLRLDLHEALREGPDAALENGQDLSATVLRKYDAQAPFYARSSGQDIEAPLLERIRRAVAPGGRLLVAGSGTGRECMALAKEGWSVAGVDFSPSMIALAREEASRRGLSPRFVLADLRRHDEPPGSIDAVIFTYDVYSFLPSSADRVELLRRMASWLAPGGVVFLSARLVSGAWARIILRLQRFGRASGGSAFTGREGGRRAWGDTHTRWVSQEGVVRRSFVHVFTRRHLRDEVSAAGLRLCDWRGGHGLLRSMESNGDGAREPAGPAESRSRQRASGRHVSPAPPAAEGPARRRRSGRT